MAGKYQNGKIYKITGADKSMVYIGSTIDTLTSRMSKHKHKYGLWKDGKNHKTTVYDIFEKFGLDNCKIELVEEMVGCESRKELERREGVIIKSTPNCVNKIVAGRTRDEYIAEKSDDIRKNKAEYRETNRELLREKQKQYCSNNKDSISKRKSEKCLCECGCYITRDGLANHRKTTKHLNNLNALVTA